MKQWLYILILSIAFVANSSAAMVMPVFMLSTSPVSGDATNITSVPAMPCHQVEKAAKPVKEADSKHTKHHCPNCEKMSHVAIGDGCGSCSCFGINSFLYGVVELASLTSLPPAYNDSYLIHSYSVVPLPLLRPPQSL